MNPAWLLALPIQYKSMATEPLVAHILAASVGGILMTTAWTPLACLLARRHVAELDPWVEFRGEHLPQGSDIHRDRYYNCSVRGYRMGKLGAVLGNNSSGMRAPLNLKGSLLG
jgi:hypothetical protein